MSTVQRTFGLFKTVPQTALDQSARANTNDEESASREALRLIDVTVLMEGGEELSDLSVDTSDAFRDGFTVEIRICDQLNRFDVRVNLPTVRQLELPKHISTGFVVYPYILADFADVDDCICEWFRTRTRPTKHTRLNVQGGVVCSGDATIPREFDRERAGWQWIASGVEYVTTDDDADCFLGVSCTMRSGDRVGCPAVATTTHTVCRRPDSFLFESRHELTPDLADDSE